MIDDRYSGKSLFSSDYGTNTRRTRTRGLATTSPRQKCGGRFWRILTGFGVSVIRETL